MSPSRVRCALGPLAAVVLSASAVAAAPGTAAGQLPRLVAEGRVGAALPTGALADDGATAGPSFGVGFAFAAVGGFYLHLGFSQHRFGCGACAGPGDLTATGFDLAVRQTWDAGFAMPWIRVGALPYSVDFEPAPGDVGTFDTDRAWGFEAGAGVAFRVGENIHLSPGGRYVSMEPELNGATVPVRGVVLDLGLIWAF